MGTPRDITHSPCSGRLSRGHRPQRDPWQQNPVSAVDKGKVTLTLRRGRVWQTQQHSHRGGRGVGATPQHCLSPTCVPPTPPPHHSLQLQSLHAEGKQGLPGPHVQESSLLSQGQCQEVLDAHLREPPCHCGQLCKDKVGMSTAVMGSFPGAPGYTPSPQNQPSSIYTVVSWAYSSLFPTLGPAPHKQCSPAACWQ